MHWTNKLGFDLKQGKCALLCVLGSLLNNLVHSELEGARLEAGGLGR